MKKIECQGKDSYESKDDANRRIFELLLDSYGGVVDLRSYKCKHCGKYHLTSRVR